MNTPDIKKGYAIFQNKPKLVYLDNAATAQTPDVIVEAMNEFYKEYNANVHRGVYDLSVQASEQYDKAHETVANFIGAQAEEVVFTSGATMSLNIVAFGLGKYLTPENNVVMTRMEHHANMVPWQQIAKHTGCELRFIELTPDGEVDMESAKQLIDDQTKIVSVIHTSNTLGTVTPLKEIISLAREVGARVIIDGAQAIAQMPVNVKELDVDFYAFSGHKLYGPTGIGVLYGKRELLEEMDPFLFGGDMIRWVSYDEAEWNDLPQKFEAGTPNIAGAIGLAKAVEYLSDIEMDKVSEHGQELTAYALEKLSSLESLTIIGSQKNRAPIISFTIEDIHPHDVAEILNKNGVAVRAGHHCTMPLMEYLGVKSTVRASFGIYNTKEDVDSLIEAIKEAQKIFKK